MTKCLPFLLTALGLTACAPLGTASTTGESALSPQILVTPLVSAGSLLGPSNAAGRSVQQVVSVKSAQDIAWLEVHLLVQTAPGRFEPVSKVTGENTTADAPDALRVELSAGAMHSPARLSNLKRFRTYLVLARAFDGGGTQISRDASSSVIVAVTSDDRPGLPVKLPVQLVDTPFQAQASVSIMVEGANFDHVRVEGFTLVDGQEVALDHLSTVLATGQSQGTLALSGLRPHTTYRLRAIAYDADGNAVPGAASQTDLAVTDDDAPSSRHLTLFAP